MVACARHFLGAWLLVIPVQQEEKVCVSVLSFMSADEIVSTSTVDEDPQPATVVAQRANTCLCVVMKQSWLRVYVRVCSTGTLRIA